MKTVAGAPGSIATATQAFQQSEASYSAWANRRQLMNGQRQTHNPTHLASDRSGTMIVRNVQTGHDRAPSIRTEDADARSASPESSGATLHGSAGLLGTIADFAYAREVKQIDLQLCAIRNHLEIFDGEIERTLAERAVETFQSALAEYALACNQLQLRMQSRRQQYLEFGVQLDNFSRTDLGSRKAGIAPARGRERYATLLSLTSTVREIVAVGDGALSSFPSTKELAPWIRGIIATRERADDNSSDLKQLWMPGEELMPLVHMYEQVDHFETVTGRHLPGLRAVDRAAADLFAHLNQASGGSAEGGAY